MDSCKDEFPSGDDMKLAQRLVAVQLLLARDSDLKQFGHQAVPVLEEIIL